MFCAIPFIAEKQVRESALFAHHFSFSAFIFLQRNLARMPPFLEGLAYSETVMLADLYMEAERLVFASPHSFFPQTSLLIWFIGAFCGISSAQASFILIFFQIILAALVSVYIFNIINFNVNSFRSRILFGLIAFLATSSNMMFSIGVGYRDLGLLMLLLLFCYLFHRGHRCRLDSVVMLLLALGATLGSPLAALIMIQFFSLFSVLWEERTVFVYALLPLSYMVYAACSYTISLKNYANFAWEGFKDFFIAICSGNLPARVSPWERLTVPTKEDIYVASLSYFSLLLLSLTVTVLLTAILMEKGQRSKSKEKEALLSATCLCLWLMLILTAATYLGASVKNEVSFSDIRTIVILFVSTMLSFAFTLKRLIEKVSGKKYLMLTVTVLLLLSFLRLVYENYPKSIFDPVNVVEDDRLSLISVHYAGLHILKFYREGEIVIDYKTSIKLWARLTLKGYGKKLLSEKTLVTNLSCNPFKKIIIFDVNGLEYPSLYTSLEAYKKAYNLSLTRNKIYDSGSILIALT
ncbi:MAG: hypothetical protein QXN87_05375 [Candidatus Bathyarchaeia archaeon]